MKNSTIPIIAKHVIIVWEKSYFICPQLFFVGLIIDNQISL
jgi:hypothetical protein